MNHRRTARCDAARYPAAMLLTIVVGLAGVGVLVKLGMMLIRDFWIIVIAWLQP